MAKGPGGRPVCREKGSDSGLGLATIAEDVSPELALTTIDEITVLGAFHASEAVKRALASRIR